MAYDAWKRAITDESQFPKEPILPILVERLMCQGDAMDCLADGRDNARKFFEKLADQNPEEPLFREIASKFRTVAQNTYRMYETLGGWQRDEKQLKALTKTENRLKIAELIEKCKAADSGALHAQVGTKALIILWQLANTSKSLYSISREKARAL